MDLLVKYRHPTTFFNPNVRLNTLIQALDGIGNLFLDVPEGCHLHPNVEVGTVSALDCVEPVTVKHFPHSTVIKASKQI